MNLYPPTQPNLVFSKLPTPAASQPNQGHTFPMVLRLREQSPTWPRAAGDCVSLSHSADSEPRIITRSEAIGLGLKVYFTGKPCPRGHVGYRWTPSGTCVECKFIRDRKRAAKRDQSKYREYHRKWRAKNRGSYREAARKWRRDHPDAPKIWAQKWRDKNPERRSAQDHNRRAKLRGAKGSHTGAQVRNLLIVQGFKCAEATCRKSIKLKYHKDHVMPIVLGGANDIKNIQLLCPTCNLRKNAKHPADWARENGRLL